MSETRQWFLTKKKKDAFDGARIAMPSLWAAALRLSYFLRPYLSAAVRRVIRPVAQPRRERCWTKESHMVKWRRLIASMNRPQQTASMEPLMFAAWDRVGAVAYCRR